MKNKKSLFVVVFLLVSVFLFSSCMFNNRPLGDLTFEGISFKSATYEYDNTIKKIEVEGLPEGASVVYENNEAIEIGTYSATATITKEGYITLVLTATLKIIKSTVPV